MGDVSMADGGLGLAVKPLVEVESSLPVQGWIAMTLYSYGEPYRCKLYRFWNCHINWHRWLFNCIG